MLRRQTLRLWFIRKAISLFSFYQRQVNRYGKCFKYFLLLNGFNYFKLMLPINKLHYWLITFFGFIFVDRKISLSTSRCLYKDFNFQCYRRVFHLGVFEWIFWFFAPFSRANPTKTVQCKIVETWQKCFWPATEGPYVLGFLSFLAIGPELFFPEIKVI